MAESLHQNYLSRMMDSDCLAATNEGLNNTMQTAPRSSGGSFGWAESHAVLQRLLDFASEKNRWQGLLELEHFHSDILDACYAETISHSESNPDSISRFLKRRRAPGDCCVFSNCKELNGHSMGLNEAIRAVHRVGLGTVVSCIPGQLTFYEGELFRDEHIPQKTFATRRDQAVDWPS
jgi:hypothetical protein